MATSVAGPPPTETCRLEVVDRVVAAAEARRDVFLSGGGVHDDETCPAGRLVQEHHGNRWPGVDVDGLEVDDGEPLAGERGDRDLLTGGTVLDEERGRVPCCPIATAIAAVAASAPSWSRSPMTVIAVADRWTCRR